MSWYLPKGSLATATQPVSLTAERAGWRYCGLEIHDLSRERTVEFAFADREVVIVPLSSRAMTVTVNGTVFDIVGRPGVFAAVADWLYAPVGASVTVTGEPGEFAVCTARAEREFPVHHGHAASVPVEPRGAGFATRQVNNIATPDSFRHAHRILVCEVLTPGGNWSSWPPHRHDGVEGCPYMNEEIYYFRLGKQRSDHGDAEATGYFHAYTVDGSVDDTVTLRDGDVYILPAGYHGPSIAAPEYPMYFLNVLAGPADERTMSFCDDPAHHWIRATWADTDPDPRCPMTSAHGKVRR